MDSRTEIEAERKHLGLPAVKVDNFVSYLKALVGFAIDMANHAHLKEADWHRTVFIDSQGVSTTDFSIDERLRLALIASGQHGAENYLQWFDNAPDNAAPINRN